MGDKIIETRKTSQQKKEMKQESQFFKKQMNPLSSIVNEKDAISQNIDLNLKERKLFEEKVLESKLRTKQYIEEQKVIQIEIDKEKKRIIQLQSLLSGIERERRGNKELNSLSSLFQQNNTMRQQQQTNCDQDKSFSNELILNQSKKTQKRKELTNLIMNLKGMLQIQSQNCISHSNFNIFQSFSPKKQEEEYNCTDDRLRELVHTLSIEYDLPE